MGTSFGNNNASHTIARRRTDRRALAIGATITADEGGNELKTIRLQMACRYLRRYGGELIGKRGSLRLSVYIGTPPEKVIPYFDEDLDIFLTDVHQHQIAHVIDLPTETGYLYARTGAFRPEILY